MPNSVSLTSSSSGLSPLIQISSLYPSDGLPNGTALSEDSITSSHPRPDANTGSQPFVSIASSPSDGLPNGSALSEDSNKAKTPPMHQGKTSRPLTIMQWNADGLKNKQDELKQRLVNSNIDILAIQETKLLGPDSGPTPDKTPEIPGYKPKRKDRTGAVTRGGGLLFYIKEDVRFQELSKAEENGLEVHTIRVQLRRKEWVRISNVYLPSSSTQETRFAPALIPSGPDSIIVGDFNAHSSLWDNVKPPDQRGKEVEDWLLDQDLSCVNDGSPTLTVKNNGSDSTPDLTLVGARWASKCIWKVEEPIGASDHLPIVVEGYDRRSRKSWL